MRLVLGGTAVAAVAAASLVTFSVLRPHDDPQQRVAGNGLVEHGSITAIEHRDAEAQAQRVEPDALVEHGSITAIEHRDARAD